MKKKWYQWLAAGAAALCLTGALAGCANKASAEKTKKAAGPSTVTLWAGGSDNVRESMEAIVTAFNKSENGKKYKMKLEFIMSGGGAQSLSSRLLAAKKTNQKNTKYDLILMSDGSFSSYVKEGGKDFFTAYKESNVPNAKNVKTKVSDGKGVIMPYRGTTVVLAYDSKRVPKPPKTTQELYTWIKSHPGRFAYNTPGSGGSGSSFVQSSLYNFLPEKALSDSDPKWQKEWNKGFDLLKELHPYLYKSGGKVVYPNKNQGTLDLLANGEVDMIPTWADMTITNLANGGLPETVKLTQLAPAFTGDVDCLAIPSVGSNPEGAQAVMNFMISKEGQQILLDKMAAIPVVDSSTLQSENSKRLAGLDIDHFRIISIGDLGSELTAQWDRQIGTLAK
ncbi:extracellular solute-binding protein [Lapidilactobacillus achengensis]|uniref:Extracellular solute-binding protein n=1 Tax=Lapidilactobacillus achengensis TaxID=2486000 RepID=A0ABW1UPK9_9LACO|nr:extracellular solute-binding protein [Lapidilactobacillus achengensis]